MVIRELTEDDFLPIHSVVYDWWGGRQMSVMLQRLFFQHFNQTSFVIEDNDKMIGFLIGFLSQSRENEAYIHFVGVHPDYRHVGVGRRLYEHFFQKILENHENMIVNCVTSPVNKNSISFHTKMGFEILSSPDKIDGIFVHKNYNGIKNDDVVFVKQISKI
ncbi:MAG: GCN5-related N-acetyltransferase [Bacillales bacterium]|jgi:ribosomal protein S18 acetylase RimI-like enzyme|nr:GCN5-related N-acetyltransferase [Bacillales bacterium]